MRAMPVPALLLLFAAALPAHAGVDLIATASLDGHRHDLAAATAAPLENGVSGNRLGGIGSGLAYAGCDTFVALPDRGPNAVPYDRAVDDSVSYITRFQTLRMGLRPARTGAPLPFVLAPKLERSTLLWTADRLYYGNGRALGLPDGTPALNRPGHDYFTGRSDNADPAHGSGWTRDGRLDPESVRVSDDGRIVYISDEYGPYVYAFDRRSGRRLDSFALPQAFYLKRVAARGAEEDARNRRGRVANHGMEGLAISPDGRVLFGVLQSPLLQDGGRHGALVRLVRIDLRTRRVSEYAYPLTDLGTVGKPKYGSVSDLLAVNGHVLLVDERDGRGFGEGSRARFKHLFLVDLRGAARIDGAGGTRALAAHALPKRDFLDIVAVLQRHGIAPSAIPAKLEGLSFGPDVVQDGRRRHTLFVASDNDFRPDIRDRLHPRGATNPTRFFVFGFDDADLPGWRPQRMRCVAH